jgi:hypothetical protein
MEETMNREALERPFPDALIRTRQGPFGRSLAYVEGAEFIKRLNESFEGHWSFEILAHHVRDTEVIVVGKLAADGVTKTAFGSSSITISRDGEVVSIGDDLKSAATDALKKCSTLLGLGLHLYSAATSNGADRGNGRSNGDHSNGGNGHSQNGGRKQGANGATNGNRLTQRQLSAIWGMGRSLGLSADQIRARSSEVFGVYPEHLSRTDASAFITELGAGLNGSGNGA